MGLFGKSQPPDPRKQVREWTSKLRKETMQLDRQIRSIQREQEKVKASLKQTAKKGDLDACKILAKELVGSRKAVARINNGKAQLNSIQLSLTHQLANARVAGALQKSTEILSCMNNLVKFTEISATMQELSREMMRAGIIDEMMEETMDEVMGVDEDEMEEQVAAEVDKVLFDLTAGQMGKAPIVSRDQLPSLPDEEEEKEKEGEIDDMQKRLEALKS